MIFQTIDLNLRTFEEIDFRLITTSKNDFRKFTYPGQRPKIPSMSHFLSCTELILPRFKVLYSVVTNTLNTSAIFAIGGYKSSGERHRSLSSVMGTKKLSLNEVGLSTLWIFTSTWQDKSCAQRIWHTSLIIQDETWCDNGIIIYVSRNIPTYPSPKPTFCLEWEVSVKCRLREGVGGQFPRNV